MMKVKHKKAFSMVTAIFVIFIMASVTALIMDITGKTMKSTSNQYQKEQAQILARSYTELAIMYVLHYDRSVAGQECLKSIKDHFGKSDNNQGYDVHIDIKYIGNDNLLDGCQNTILNDGTLGTAVSIAGMAGTATWGNDTTGGFYNTISIVIDTYISYKVLDHPFNQNIDPNDDIIRTFHRRTLQKL